MSVRGLDLLSWATAVKTAPYEKKVLSYSARQFEMISYARCEYLWSYGGKMALITRNLLNAVARSSYTVFIADAELPNKIKNFATRMKLLSIVSVPFGLVDLKTIVYKTFNSLSLSDHEGLAMAALSFTMTAADVFDSVTTFVNSLLVVMARTPIGLFSSLGLPLGYLISGTGTVSRTIQIAKAFSLFRNINSEAIPDISNRSKADIRKYLVEKLGIAREENLINLLSCGQMDQSVREKIERLKERSKAIILRLIPKDVMHDFDKLFALFEVESDKPFTDKEAIAVHDNLTRICLQLQKKMSLDLLGIAANLIIISALALFSMGITSAWPFLLMALAFTIRLFMLVYQENKN